MLMKIQVGNLHWSPPRFKFSPAICNNAKPTYLFKQLCELKGCSFVHRQYSCEGLSSRNGLYFGTFVIYYHGLKPKEAE